MDSRSNHRMDTRAALEDLVKSIRNSDWIDRSSQMPDGQTGSGTGSHGGYPNAPRTKRADPADLMREREMLDRRAVQLDRMEEILRNMLRAVERREDEVREREKSVARSDFDDDMKIELLRREQALQEAEKRLADRERFIKETESVLLMKAREIAGSK